MFPPYQLQDQIDWHDSSHDHPVLCFWSPRRFWDLLRVASPDLLCVERIHHIFCVDRLLERLDSGRDTRLSHTPWHHPPVWILENGVWHLGHPYIWLHLLLQIDISWSGSPKLCLQATDHVRLALHQFSHPLPIQGVGSILHWELEDSIYLHPFLGSVGMVAHLGRWVPPTRRGC